MCPRPFPFHPLIRHEISLRSSSHDIIQGTLEMLLFAQEPFRFHSKFVILILSLLGHLLTERVGKQEREIKQPKLNFPKCICM